MTIDRETVERHMQMVRLAAQNNPKLMVALDTIFEAVLCGDERLRKENETLRVENESLRPIVRDLGNFHFRLGDPCPLCHTGPTEPHADTCLIVRARFCGY